MRGMAEGVIDDGNVVDVGVGDRGRPPEPPADPDRAPYGWTLDRKSKEWRPKKRAGRGGTRTRDQDDGEADAPPAAAADTGGGWEAERDPEPARLSDRGGKRNRPAQAPDKVPQETRDDIASVCGLLGLVVLEPIARADPICGGALVDNWERITEKMIPLLVRSPRIVGWMTAGEGLRDWIGLGISLSPVVTAVWSHHVTKTVHVDEHEHGQPTIAQEDGSVYPAA